MVTSIAKGAAILRSLSNGIDRISDLSSKLQFSKSTTHRLLKALEASELVTEDPITRRYYLGPLVLTLASKPIIAHQNLIICSFEEMKRLRDFSRETVLLHIRIGLERICLEEIQSPENIKYTSGKGFIAPIYTGSAGKILLSTLGDHELELLLENIQLIPIGPNTITNVEELLKQLAMVRKQGYATSFGERVQGSACISVAIKNYICPAALSVLGPDNRFSMDKMMDALKEMKKSAPHISRKLAEANQRGRLSGR